MTGEVVWLYGKEAPPGAASGSCWNIWYEHELGVEVEVVAVGSDEGPQRIFVLYPDGTWEEA